MAIKDTYSENEKKPLISLEILEQKYNIDKKYLFIPLILLVFFLINRKYFLFGLLTVFSGVFSFYHDKFNRTDLDFKMPLFLGIMITWKFGIVYTLIFFILSDVIPLLLSGGNIGALTIPFYTLYFAINSLVLLFPNVDIITLGIILVWIEFLGTLIIKKIFGIPMFMGVLSSLFSVVVRSVYFLTLGPVLVTLFNTLL